MRRSAPPRLLLAACMPLVCAGPALAQARNPFSVGISEGGGTPTGITGWILSQQGWFEHAMSAAVRGSQSNGTAVWGLVGLSFLYGVFHAAGPGHGKAVLTSYMVANERALRRGVTLSALAALLQGLVAVVLVGVAALLFHATAGTMRLAASAIETASFVAVAALGAWLTVRKGAAFLRLVRRPAFDFAFSPPAPVPARAGGLSFASAVPIGATGRFVCAEPEHVEAEGCAHCIGPDAAIVSGPGFSFRDAALTVLAAGSRPCSGAILVLVFALAQGVFPVGVVAVLAMSVGVALTTAGLASTAVLATAVARRLTRPGTRGASLWIGGLELAAALLVLGAGLALLAGTASAGA